MKLDFLKQHLVGFVSDGVSNMMGRKAGVGVLLQNIFPDLIIWHYCNHRLELAVSDAIKKVQDLITSNVFFLKNFILCITNLPKTSQNLMHVQHLWKIGF